MSMRTVAGPKSNPLHLRARAFTAASLAGLLAAACAGDALDTTEPAALGSGSASPAASNMAAGSESELPATPGAAGAAPTDGAAPGSSGALSEDGAPPGDATSTPSADGSTQDSAPGSAEQTELPAVSGAEQIAEDCAALGPGVHAGVTKLRRLTQKQFDNTVRDLLGIDDHPAAAFSPDERIGPFQSNAVAPITPLLVQQHDEVARDLATRAIPRMAELAACDLASGGESCAADFIRDFGLRVYRRPLDGDEHAAYLALYQTGLTEGGAEGAFELVLSTLLASPNFVYHVDSGASAEAGAAVPLSPHELASRLSYFLWNTMPDAELFAKAADGSLSDVSVLQGEALRMLDDPRAADAIPEFHLQWLGIGTLQGVNKDPTLFPIFDPALAEAMTKETRAFSDYVIRRGDGLMSSLFLADYSFPEGGLFDLYGLSEPAGLAAGEPVSLGSPQRMGILTQAAFLARHAHPNQTSPVHRGMVLRENVLCTPIASPPPDVNNVPPQPTEATTTRERFAQHSSDPTCAGCHQLMDPIGLAFEHYDPIGAWRDEDGVSAVDASGEVLGARDPALAGSFVGAIELSRKFAESEQVAECLANQWFRFALGRIESGDDACTMQSVHASFAASNRNIRELLSELVTSDAFRHVRYLERSSLEESP